MSDPPLHATTVAIDRCGVVLIGPSGAGKSDLALRLIDLGAVLVSDDYTVFAARGGIVHAAPPATTAGKLEVRGIGIVTMAHVACVPVALAVHLGRPVERMPERSSIMIAGVRIPAVTLDPFQASAPIKVHLALDRAREAS